MILGPFAGAAVALLVGLLAGEELRRAYRPDMSRSGLLVLELPLLALVLALCLVRLSQLI